MKIATLNCENLFSRPKIFLSKNATTLLGYVNGLMEHDGWKGVLTIDRIWQSRVEKIGTCGYPTWCFSGNYKSHDNKVYNMTGKIGGRDLHDKNTGCKRSDHKVSFTISFPNNNQTLLVMYTRGHAT